MEFNEDFNEGQLIKIEAKLLEQEHRPTHLVLNYLRRKTNYPDENDLRRKAVSKAIVWRLFFSPAVLAFGGTSIIGLITLFFMWKQNDIANYQTKIISDQRNLLEEQNRKLEIQTNLEESNRRNNLVFLMDNILNKVGDEISENNDKSLSEPILARIQALGQGFQPYKFLNYYLKDQNGKDSLGLTNELSPERGQLLLALVYSGIEKKTMDKIFDRTSFTQSYLRKARLDSSYLEGVNLSYAYLSGAELTYANLRNSSLTGINGRGAFLNNAILSNAFMAKINFEYANLSEVDFSNAFMAEANLEYANLTEANFNNSFLEQASLFHSDLTGADFRDVISLDSCLVHRYDWIVFIRDSLNLEGSEQIYQDYYIAKDYTFNDRFWIRRK